MMPFEMMRNEIIFKLLYLILKVRHFIYFRSTGFTLYHLWMKSISNVILSESSLVEKVVAGVCFIFNST